MDKITLATHSTDPKELDKRFLSQKSNNLKELDALSKDSYYAVRCSVAKNQNTPKEILEQLSKDWHYLVKRSVAENPNTPKNTANTILLEFSIKAIMRN